MIERTKEKKQMKERESEMKWVCIQKNDRRSRPEKGGRNE